MPLNLKRRIVPPIAVRSYSRKGAGAPLLQSDFGGRVGRDQQPHRQHRGFVEAMALEKLLGTQLRPIGQQRDAEKFFLLGEVDCVFEQLRAVAMAAKRIVHDEVLKENDETALRRADRKEQIDHADDGAIAPQDKDAPAIRFLENQAQPLELFLLVRAEILLLAEELAEKIGQFVQIFKNGRLDNDFAHGRLVIPQTLKGGNADVNSFLALDPNPDLNPITFTQDQEMRAEPIDKASRLPKVAALQRPTL